APETQNAPWVVCLPQGSVAIGAYVDSGCSPVFAAGYVCGDSLGRTCVNVPVLPSCGLILRRSLVVTFFQACMLHCCDFFDGQHIIYPYVFNGTFGHSRV